MVVVDAVFAPGQGSARNGDEFSDGYHYVQGHDDDDDGLKTDAEINEILLYREKKDDECEEGCEEDDEEEDEEEK